MNRTAQSWAPIYLSLAPLDMGVQSLAPIKRKPFPDEHERSQYGSDERERLEVYNSDFAMELTVSCVCHCAHAQPSVNGGAE